MPKAFRTPNFFNLESKLACSQVQDIKISGPKMASFQACVFNISGLNLACSQGLDFHTFGVENCQFLGRCFQQTKITGCGTGDFWPNPTPENGHFPPRKCPIPRPVHVPFSKVKSLPRKRAFSTPKIPCFRPGFFAFFSVLQVCKFEAHMLKVVLKVRSVEQVHFVDSLSLEGATGSYASL